MRGHPADIATAASSLNKRTHKKYNAILCRATLDLRSRWTRRRSTATARVSRLHRSLFKTSGRCYQRARLVPLRAGRPGRHPSFGGARSSVSGLRGSESPHQTPRPEIQSEGRRVDVRSITKGQVARPAAACRQGRAGRLIRPAARVRAADGAVRRTLTDKYT